MADLEPGAREIEEARGRRPEGDRLHALFDLHWRYALDEYPELATYTGDPGRNHRWTDHSLEAYERRDREMEVPARVLATIDRAALSERDRVHHDLFRRSIEDALEGRRFKGEYMPLTQMGGVQQNVAQTLMMMPYAQPSHYEDAIARLEGVPRLVEQTIALLGKGLETTITPPRVTLRDVPQQVRNQLVDDPWASPLLRPFSSFPPAVAGGDQDRLRAAAGRAYAGVVAPAYGRLLEYLEATYLPRTRETIAMRDLPDGEAWYAFSVRQMTTTRLGADQIHRIGLEEVRRIRAEMEAVMARTGYEGTFQQFVGFLRSDDRFFFDRAEDLLVAYRDICKRVDPELTKLFATLPRLPYGVVPVPSYAEKSQTTAYYEPGSPSAGRPGRFFANTYDLRARPKWEMEALAYKIGELKIKELRARAAAALGARFDLRRFHDHVLGAGALPLDVLEARVEAWIAGQA